MSNIFNILSEEVFKDRMDTTNIILASMAEKWGNIFDVPWSNIQIKSWEDLQRINRLGLGDKLLKVGDQFTSSYGAGGQILWNVIGINHDTPTDKQYKYSITLQAQDCILDTQFDAVEATYYAESEKVAGSYYINTNSKNYQFTLTQAIPVGGQARLVVSEMKIYTYSSRTATTVIEAVTVIEGTTGTQLTPVNYYDRTLYGSNNYKESAVRQWLNSNAEPFIWEPKTNYDRPPLSAPYTGYGFLKLLDPELTAVLGSVDKQVSRNTVNEGGGQDLISNKIFLPSRVEVGLGAEGVVTGEQVYSWYDGATNAKRIKLLNGTPRRWWLRSPNVSGSHRTRGVGTSGALDHYGAGDACGVSPACVII